ncbi:response regulator transcription factor [Baekduia sp. Peel2402]|uniref:response regulator transcription factor n=1 Tax=Baekduia sp. Peel2402 TaxID=3458296 RepID=UPI00403EB882
MGRLSERDLRAVLDLVGEAHDVEDLDEFRAVLLPALNRLLPADFAAYNELVDGGVPVATITDPVAPPSQLEAWARYAAQNPLYQRFMRTRDGRAYCFADVISRRDLERLDVYQEIFVPLGLRDQIAFTLPAPRFLTIGLAISRGGKEFGERERGMLDLARPHLVQAYRNAELRQRSASLIESLRTGLDDRQTAVVVLDADRRVAFATEAGHATLARLDRRTFRRAGEEATLPRALQDWVERPEAGHALALGDGLVARVVRGGGRGAGDVLFFDEARQILSRSALVELGLSEREADVLQELARGGTTAEAATALGISERTVAKHSERIHRKLGVRSRSQAIATAAAAASAGDSLRQPAVAS